MAAVQQPGSLLRLGGRGHATHPGRVGPSAGRPERGGPAGRFSLEGLELATAKDDGQFLAVHEALDELAETDPDAATLVKLRFFAGLTAAPRVEE